MDWQEMWSKMDSLIITSTHHAPMKHWLHYSTPRPHSLSPLLAKWSSDLFLCRLRNHQTVLHTELKAGNQSLSKQKSNAREVHGKPKWCCGIRNVILEDNRTAFEKKMFVIDLTASRGWWSAATMWKMSVIIDGEPGTWALFRWDKGP